MSRWEKTEQEWDPPPALLVNSDGKDCAMDRAARIFAVILAIGT